MIGELFIYTVRARTPHTLRIHSNNLQLHQVSRIHISFQSLARLLSDRFLPTSRKSKPCLLASPLHPLCVLGCTLLSMLFLSIIKITWSGQSSASLSLHGPVLLAARSTRPPPADPSINQARCPVLIKYM
jgi:hypothetical protein